MKIEPWPDDPTFDPRLRWAEENAEDLSALIFEKKLFDQDMMVLSYIESAPRTSKEIAAHFQFDEGRARQTLQSLRRRGIVFSTHRDKTGDCLIYRINTKPDRIAFFYPKNVNKYK